MYILDITEGNGTEVLICKVFTRWCNERLKSQKIIINDLAVDLTDKRKLWALLQVFSSKPIGQYNRRHWNKAQRVQNFILAQEFLRRVENIRNSGNFLMHVCHLIMLCLNNACAAHANHHDHAGCAGFTAK